jgi:hypothetical protein
MQAVVAAILGWMSLKTTLPAMILLIRNDGKDRI